MDQTIMHCIFLGAAGVGKSSLMKRLLRMKLDSTRTSTQIAEKSVRVEVRDVSTAVAQVSGLDWQIIEDPGTQAHGLMEQIFTEPEKTKSMEVNQRVFKSNTVEETSAQASKKKVELQEKVIKEDNLTTTSTQKSRQVFEQEREPDSSIVTESPAESSEHTTSKNQPSQLHNIAFLRKVIKEKGVLGLKQHINNPWTLYLTDSGGQPDFQELLPALVVGPCVFFVVFPLDKDMKKKYTVQYVRPDEQKCMKVYTSSFTLQEDLMQTLASIASTKYKNKDGNEVMPRVVFVATFIDKVSQEDIQRKLDNIEAMIKGTDVFRQDMVVYASETQMVFTINNVSEEAEKDAHKIRDAFRKIAKYFRVPTPYPWLIFGILVQHEYGNDNSVVWYKDCFKLAQECGIHSETEFEAALQFLHKQTGILHYHKKPTELSHIVIRNPQHLFTRVNHLVEKTFVFEETAFGKCINDFKKGIFKREDYDTLTREFSKSKLTPSMLLKLLEHLNIVVPLGDSQKYFMPCAIAHLDEANLIQSAMNHESTFSHPTIPPLLITFKSGYCPKGLFGALVACIANKQVANCTLGLDEVCFTMGQYNLLLRVNSAYIYVETIPSESGTLLSSLCTQCNDVRRLIFHNIKIACETLHYSDDADCCLSFKCPCNGEQEGFHPAALRKDKNNCFLCIQSKKVVEVRKECYMWLPQVSRQLHGVVTKCLVSSELNIIITKCTINNLSKLAHPMQ